MRIRPVRALRSAFSLGLLGVAACLALAGPALAGTLRKPIDPLQQRALHFGDRSHWLQPWRAYLETPPATRLRDAIGINLTNRVDVEDVPATMRLLGRSGFRRVRIEVGWGEMDYDHPTHLRTPG